MKLCIVGIGGCGGNVTEQFLGNQDISVSGLNKLTHGEYISDGDIKGLWLEADVNAARNKQNFFGSIKDGSYPGVLIPHDAVPDGCPTHIIVREKYGYDLKKQGFFREAQYLKGIFEIFEDDEDIQKTAKKDLGHPNPILGAAWDVVRPFTTLGQGDCDAVLFIVSLGGGTGTGFINPIMRHIRSEGKTAYPVFVLGVLTEVGDLSDREQLAKEKQRDLGATISIYDLTTKRIEEGVDGLILVDNQALIDQFGQDYTRINHYLYEVMRPIVAARPYPMEDPPGLAIRQQSIDSVIRPPILVPCYAMLARREDSEKALVDKAIKSGMLFACEPQKADKAFVFSRGYLDSAAIRKAINDHTGLEDVEIAVWRKLGDNKHDEILILLRNPYGTPGAQTVKGTFENRIYNLIEMGLEYIDENRMKLLKLEDDGQGNDSNNEKKEQNITEKTREALDSYFYGEGGLKTKLKEAMRKIERGEKPFFRDELRIFDSGRRGTSNDWTDNSSRSGALSPEDWARIRQIIKEEMAKGKA